MVTDNIYTVLEGNGEFRVSCEVTQKGVGRTSAGLLCDNSFLTTSILWTTVVSYMNTSSGYYCDFIHFQTDKVKARYCHQTARCISGTLEGVSHEAILCNWCIPSQNNQAISPHLPFSFTRHCRYTTFSLKVIIVFLQNHAGYTQLLHKFSPQVKPRPRADPQLSWNIFGSSLQEKQ